MTYALVALGVLAALELLIIIGLFRAGSDETFRRMKAEVLLKASVPLLPQGPLTKAIGKWLAHVSDDGGTT